MDERASNPVTGPGPIAIELPFTGRLTELDRLHHLAATRAVRGVVLRGPAGVGKSALAGEFLRRRGRARTETLWLSAAPSLQALPLGAFAPILPTRRDDDDRTSRPLDRIEVVTDALDQLRGDLGGVRLLAVDDVHLLDPASALLLSLVIADLGCFAVMTMTSGGDLAPELNALWRSGLVEVLEVAPLSRDLTDQACREALGGIVDRRARERVCDAAAGNLLVLRELLRGGIESGRLRADDGVWRWEGPLAVTAHLAELVGSRLSSAGEDVVRVVRLVALGEPLPMDALRELCPPRHIEAAEALGLVAISRRQRRTTVALAHPIYGEVLRERDGSEVVRRAAGELAECLASAGTQRQHDPLRLALLELQANTARPDVNLLMHATALARRLGDLDLAVTFARSAADAEPGPVTLVELVECLTWQGSHDEAMDVAGDIDASELTDVDRARLAVNLATILFFGRDEADEAIAELSSAERAVRDTGALARLLAHRAELHMFSGDITPALAAAAASLESPGVPCEARAAAFGARVPSLALAGRINEAVVAADEGLGFLLAQPDPPIYEGAGIVVGRLLAAVLGGDLAGSRAMVEDLYREGARHPADPLFAVWALMLGRALLAAGEPRGAVDLLEEAASSFRRADPGHVLTWSLGALAQAHGMLGSGEAAAATVTEMSGAGARAIRAFDVDRAVGRAWAAASAGHLAQAREEVSAAASNAFSTGATGSGLFAVFEGFRLGLSAGAARELCPASMTVEGPLLPVVGEICTTDLDPPGLVRCAERVAELGFGAWAVDLAATAVSRAESAADADGARRARLCLDSLEPEARGLVTPALVDAADSRGGVHLTKREREIVALIRGGRTNGEIAEVLVVSKRTVESHIGRVFNKLGVTDRSELM